MQSVIPKQGQAFYGEAGSIMDGAQLLTVFQQQGEVWIAAGLDTTGPAKGVCQRGHPACLETTAVFIDGRPLDPAPFRASLRPGQFSIDPSNHSIRFVDDPTGKRVEAAVARHAFSGGANDVVVQGLVIEHYANAAQEGAIWPAGRGWTVKHVEARYNAGVGIVVGSGSSIVDCDVHDNGQLGIGVGGAVNVLIAGNDISSNNTRSYDYDWEAGGVKVAASKNVKLIGNHVFSNRGPGLWCDEDCVGIVFANNIVEQNASAGIFFEISSKAEIHDNTVSENNQDGLSWFWGADIQVAASDHVDVRGNTIRVRPFGRAVMLVDQNRRRAGGGFYKTEHDRVFDNKITFLGSGFIGGVSDAPPAAANAGIIQTGENSFEHNDYNAAPGSQPQFIWGQDLLDFVGFRLQGQEIRGSLTNK